MIDKTKEDYEYEKNKDELTFAPKLQRGSDRPKYLSKVKTGAQTKAEAKQLERM